MDTDLAEVPETGGTSVPTLLLSFRNVWSPLWNGPEIHSTGAWMEWAAKPCLF